MTTEFKVEVGAYAIHHVGRKEPGSGSLVRVCRAFDVGTEQERFGIEYVGHEAQGGGSSFAWPAHEFEPISRPEDAILARLYEQRRQKVEHERAAAENARQIAALQHALSAIREVIAR